MSTPHFSRSAPFSGIDGIPGIPTPAASAAQKWDDISVSPQTGSDAKSEDISVEAGEAVNSFPAESSPAGKSAGEAASQPLTASPAALRAREFISQHPDIALAIHAEIQRDNDRRFAPRNPKSGLTIHQKELLAFIKARYEIDGISPSYDEMRDAMGLNSKSGVNRLIIALEERGYIRRLPNRARAIVPVEA
jgi:hypothetical protein